MINLVHTLEVQRCRINSSRFFSVETLREDVSEESAASISPVAVTVCIIAFDSQRLPGQYWPLNRVLAFLGGIDCFCKKSVRQSETVPTGSFPYLRNDGCSRASHRRPGFTVLHAVTRKSQSLPALINWFSQWSSIALVMSVTAGVARGVIEEPNCSQGRLFRGFFATRRYCQ